MGDVSVLRFQYSILFHFLIYIFYFKRYVGRCGEIQENGLDRRDHAPLVEASAPVHGLCGRTDALRHSVAAVFGKEDRRPLVQVQLAALE